MAYADTSSGPTYCTVEDVEETLGLPSRDHPQEIFRFSDVSNPTYNRVERYILGAEDMIDQRTRSTWRVNHVKDHMTSIKDYWADQNGFRTQFYLEGGDYVQLRKDILPWDPEEGDKLEIRMHSNAWMDITDTINTNEPPTGPTDRHVSFWFDYPMGKLYIRTHIFQRRPNALRISYRYGSTEPVPEGIRRLCELEAATRVLTGSIFDIKVGMGGDISGVKDSLLRNWAEEKAQLYSSFQRSGSVHSLLR